jgi:hypothetical protein
VAVATHVDVDGAWLWSRVLQAAVPLLDVERSTTVVRRAFVAVDSRTLCADVVVPPTMFDSTAEVR